jgi:hypothetical protein
MQIHAPAACGSGFRGLFLNSSSPSPPPEWKKRLNIAQDVARFPTSTAVPLAFPGGSGSDSDEPQEYYTREARRGISNSGPILIL